MMKMTFVFDNNRLQQVGKTADEVIEPMRVHAKKWHIDEVAPYQFEKDGKDALCDLFMFIPEILEKDKSYYTYFSKWYVEQNGQFYEDRIEGSKDALAVMERNNA